MVSHDLGRNVPAEGEALNATAVNARTIAASIERLKRSRGATVHEARRAIARGIRAGYGTINNIIRDRVKRTDERIRDRLQVLLVREIESEISRLQHELEMVRRSGAALASDQVREIEAHLQAAKSLLKFRA